MVTAFSLCDKGHGVAADFFTGVSFEICENENSHNDARLEIRRGNAAEQARATGE